MHLRMQMSTKEGGAMVGGGGQPGYRGVVSMASCLIALMGSYCCYDNNIDVSQVR